MISGYMTGYIRVIHNAGYLVLIIASVMFCIKLAKILLKKHKTAGLFISVAVSQLIAVLGLVISKAMKLDTYIIDGAVIISIIVYMIGDMMLSNVLKVSFDFFNKQDKRYILSFIVINIAGITLLFLCKNKIAIFENDSVFMVLMAFMLIMLYLFYKITVKLYEENINAKEADRLRNQLDSNTQYLNNVKMMDKQIRMIKHDMNNQLQVVADLIKNHEYDKADELLKKIGVNLNKTQDYINTNNSVLNTIINNKIDMARSQKIEFTVCIHKSVKKMDDVDICSVVGNVLDNAIEAELKETEDKREIELYIFWDGQDCVLRVKNYISKAVLCNNPELNTSKTDKKYHGLGTSIIKDTVEKYNGTVDMYEENDMFCCEVRW